METEIDLSLSRIAMAFQVNDIATYELITCDGTQDPRELMDKYLDIDQFPINNSGRITGVIERVRDFDNKPYQEHPLDEGILVSADEPLSNFLPLLAEPPYYRLVLRGTNIQGIVTKSDVQKIPVRSYAFALVTQLELIMIQRIREDFPDNEDWSDFLPKTRKESLEDRFLKSRNNNMDISKLELTELCDKRVILKRKYQLGKKFVSDLEQIEKLRNKLAHANDFIKKPSDLVLLIDTLEKCKIWIGNIQGLN